MKKILFSALVFLITGLITQSYAQATPSYGAQNPTVASLMRFEEIPASTYTGVPGISIPLYQLTTRSKDIGLDLTLGYHPSAVTANSADGDVGLGWSLFSGGAVSRDLRDYNIPDEVDFKNYPTTYQEGNDLFQYSIQGISGRFYLAGKSSGMRIKIVDSKPSAVDITMNYDASTLEINSFTITDLKGYKYVFDNYETKTSNFSISMGNPWSPIVGQFTLKGRSTWFISAIYDKNNKLLMSYSYNTYSTPTQTNPLPSQYDISKTINTITVEGKGKAEFSYTGRSSITQIAVKTLDNQGIKKINLTYLTDFKNRRRLHQVIEGNFIDQKTQTHTCEYLDFDNGNMDELGVDRFGYYKNNESDCEPSVVQSAEPDLTYCKLGVLSKITYPTGGFTTYEYESNAFAYDNDDEEEFAFDYSGEPQNNHKEYIYNDMDGFPPSGTFFNFTIPTTGTYYVRVNIPPTTVTPGIDNGSGSNASYSQVKIKNIAGPAPSYPDSYGSDLLTNAQANDNDCYGREVYLVAGNYKFDIVPANFQVGCQVIKKASNSNIQQLIYGGGIRIKEIAMYTSEDDTAPAKKTQYSYQMFNNTLRSSGSMPSMYDFDFISGTFNPKKEMVGYKNVTVTETGKGRTEITYLNSGDFQLPGDGLKITPYYDYKTGLPLKKAVYDEQGRLLKVSETAYEFAGDTIQGPGRMYERNGYVKTKNILNKDYSYEGATSKIVQIKNTESYTADKDINYTITNADNITDAVKTQYSYWPYLSVNGYVKELDQIQTFRGGDVTSTQKTLYATGNSPNSSYMPSFLQASKGTQLLENKINFLSYDEYGNPLELKQVSGISVSYIWGYNKTQVIAMIENAAYSSISSSLITAAQNASNGTNEAALITALNNIRTALPNANITTYTYKPLIGVSTITNPAGDRITYEYDNFGRLLLVKDKFDKIISENKYNYKQ